ncbi:MAG: peptidoglycan editing factor PgeF [Lachnospiraceae bacterium]|nr:peptidoglycan editing factor PgeF [Lachnospiraceae bacterium]
MNYKRKGHQPILQEQIYRNEDGSRLPVLVFPALNATGFAQHCFTTRLGGVSGGYLGTLNLSFTRGDDPANVHENFRRVAAVFGKGEDSFVLSCQEHHTNVRRVGREDAGAGVIKPLPWTDVDGLITDEPGIILGTFFADCVPLLFVDPVHRAVGASHSGWRGSVSRMGAVTLRRMREEFGTRPADVLCAVGPSICQEHYEVSSDVAECFRKEFPGYEEQILIDKEDGHALLNLWEVCRITLLEAGVPDKNISVTDICTCCNPELLFSHRASRGRRGNFGSFIMIKDV